MDEGRGNLEYDSIEGNDDNIFEKFRSMLPFICAFPYIGSGWCDIIVGDGCCDREVDEGEAGFLECGANTFCAKFS